MLRTRVAPMLLAGWLLPALPVPAHETWFAVDTSAPGGRAPLLALGTGEQYPAQQSSPGSFAPQRAACQLASGQVQTLAVARDTPAALLFEAPAADVLQCWASLERYKVALSPAKAAVYLDEIHAPDSVREVWAARMARSGPAGAQWQESFVKSARIVLGAGGGPATSVALTAAAAHALPLDIVPEALPTAPGGWLRVQVLRDGQPLAGQNVHVACARAGLGFWLRSDAQGRAAVRLPLPGAWLVRGTDLRPAGEGWESRWATLALTVAQR